MLRLRFLFTKFSRSFSVFPPKSNFEKAAIDMKFSSAKNLDSFLNDIDITRTSPSILAYTLKLVQDNFQADNLTADKLSQICDEAINNVDKFDLQDIANLSEWIGYTDYKLKVEDRKKLISRVNELIAARDFDRNQILTIFKNVPPLGYSMPELRNEVAKIVYSPEVLTFEEISKIVIGSGSLIYDQHIGLLVPCIDRIIEISNKEELDVKYLSKILDVLAIKSSSQLRDHLIRFWKIIEKTLPKWSENDLISIIKFYKNYYNDFDKEPYFYALERIDKFLTNKQNIKIKFAIEVLSLLKKEAREVYFRNKIIRKCEQIIREKLNNQLLKIKDLMKIFDAMEPCIDIETALLIKKQITDKTYIQSLNIFQKVSWLSVNNDGRLFPLTDIFPLKIDGCLKKAKSYQLSPKISMLERIANTKNYELHDLHEIKDLIIESLKERFRLNNKSIEDFCRYIITSEYSSNLIKILAPLQDDIYIHLQKEGIKSLKFSILFFESNPEKWQDFAIKNKNNFSYREILETIKGYRGPFEAIVYLLKIFRFTISSEWISLAMKRAIETQDADVLNDFANIVNKMDPHYLLNCQNIFTKFEFFNHLHEYANYRLVKDLFVNACKLIKDLPVDTIFSNFNIRILYFAEVLGVLEPEIADIVANNYRYFKKLENVWLLAISSKCSDAKLRECIVKQVFHEKIDFKIFKTFFILYWKYPEIKEIDSYILDTLKLITQSQTRCLIYIPIIVNILSKFDRNDHLELFNGICSLMKDLILGNLERLNFKHINHLLSLADKDLPVDLDFGYIIPKIKMLSKYSNNEISRVRLIEKIKNSGISDKNVVLAICDKQDNFSSAYLAETISCLADLRFENEEWASKMASYLIDYAEDKKLVFEDDVEYINWIYGLVNFKVNKSIILKHIENSRYFDCEQPTFKHFLLANHIQMNQDYKNINILDQKLQKYWHKFDFFNHFGINKSLIDLIESSLNEANLEVKIGEFIDKIWVPFYIPNKEIALWPATNSIFLYRSELLRGEFNIHRNHILGKLKNLHILNKEMIDQIGKKDIKQCLKI